MIFARSTLAPMEIHPTERSLLILPETFMVRPVAEERNPTGQYSSCRQLQARNKPVTPENIAALRAEMAKDQELADKTGYVFTQTHENIVVNPQFPSSDFVR